MLPITSLYAGLLALLFIALSWRVIAVRRSEKVSLGDGENKDLRQRIRAHGNFAEYAPMGLILLACVELQGAPAVAVHVLGLILLAGRALHAMSLWRYPINFTFRTWGMLATFVMLGLSGAGLILHGLF